MAGRAKRLLAQEKEFTRARDRLNAERRRLPMVRIDKEHVFEAPDGRARPGKSRPDAAGCQPAAGGGDDTTNTNKRSTTRGIDGLGDVSFDAVRRTPTVPVTRSGARKGIPGARLLQLQRADHGVELTDWDTIVHAIHEHTGEAR